MRGGRSAVLLGVALLLTGCDETVRPEDGVIPDRSVAAFEPYLGDYLGRFDGRDAVLVFALDDARAVLSMLDAEGAPVDMLGADCRSSIGDMIMTRFDKDRRIKSSVFAFDLGFCAGRVSGTQAELLFAGEPSSPVDVTLRIERSMVVRQECRRESGRDGGGQDCRNVKEITYLQGDFRRETF